MGTSSTENKHRKNFVKAENTPLFGDVAAVSLATDSDVSEVLELAKASIGTPVALACFVDHDGNWWHQLSDREKGASPYLSELCNDVLKKNEERELISTPIPSDMANAAIEGEEFRFFAGTAIAHAKKLIGVLCVLDDNLRAELSASDEQCLQKSGSLVSTLIRLKLAGREKGDAAAALKRSDLRHSLALEAAAIGTWAWNLVTNEVEIDNRVAELFELDPAGDHSADEMLAQIHPEDRARVDHSIAEALEKDEEYHAEFRIAGSEKWLVGRGRVLDYGEDGTPRTLIGVNMNITSQVEREENTTLLLRELNHRVKNTLAVLQSMAVQTLRRSKSTADFTKAFSGRLQAISAAHGLLSDREWRSINLYTLVERQVSGYGEIGQNINISGNDLPLAPDQGLGLGLVLHELATNAAKYGALSNDNGTISIHCEKASDRETPSARITWKESGGGKVEEPEERGFGTILIERSLDKIVDSEVSIDYGPEGLVATIILPLSSGESMSGFDPMRKLST